MIKVDLERKVGPIKLMNTVNNGPVRRHTNDQKRTNFEDFKKLNVGYVRTHDSSLESSYGLEHTVDVNAIFPNFDLDPYDENSYDFQVTDYYLSTIKETGAQVFYRLGHRIEHQVKKYGTLPPKDFKKWAIICEHIIRHYNEGWANGYHMDIEYWEIWNEPNLDPDDSDHKKTWGGTWKQFLELYAISSRHLKDCFPHLKIGGPAMADGNLPGPIEEFLSFAKENELPLDFFSWHFYCNDPMILYNLSVDNRALLDKYGFVNTENILNEWNYVRDWVDGFVYSVEQIIGIKGAAFAASTMCLCQKAPLDMLTYYDARPCAFNGLFNFYTYKPMKTYHVFRFFNQIKEIGTQVESTDTDNIKTIAAYDGNSFAMMLSYFEEDDSVNEEVMVEINIDGADFDELTYTVLDDSHDGEEYKTVDIISGKEKVPMKPQSVVFLQNK